MLIGALIGDYIGSYYETKEHRTKDYNFELYRKENHFTDDSILTIAIIDGLLEYLEEKLFFKILKRGKQSLWRCLSIYKRMQSSHRVHFEEI